MRVIYIAGPYRALNGWQVEQNIRRAENLAVEVNVLSDGKAIALCPHSLSRFYAGVLPEEYWLAGTLELMRRSDATLMMPGWEKSDGSRRERTEAEQRGMPVFFNLQDLEWWLKNVPAKPAAASAAISIAEFDRLKRTAP
jgi:hypothetical protein